MQILEGQDDLSSVKPGVWFAEPADATQMRKHFAASNKFQSHVQIRVILKKFIVGDKMCNMISFATAYFNPYQIKNHFVPLLLVQCVYALYLRE